MEKVKEKRGLEQHEICWKKDYNKQKWLRVQGKAKKTGSKRVLMKNDVTSLFVPRDWKQLSYITTSNI